MPRSLSVAVPKLGAAMLHHSRGALAAARGSVLSLGLMLIMAVLIVMLLVNFGTQVVQSARLESNRAALQAEVDRLRYETMQLEGAVEFAESDVNVERVAREQLNYAREGDQVILPQVTLPPAAPAPEAIAPLPEPAVVPNWQRWYQVLFPT